MGGLYIIIKLYLELKICFQYLGEWIDRKKTWKRLLNLDIFYLFWENWENIS